MPGRDLRRQRRAVQPDHDVHQQAIRQDGKD
jgi:hypothetical protein